MAARGELGALAVDEIAQPFAAEPRDCSERNARAAQAIAFRDCSDARDVVAVSECAKVAIRLIDTRAGTSARFGQLDAGDGMLEPQLLVTPRLIRVRAAGRRGPADLPIPATFRLCLLGVHLARDLVLAGLILVLLLTRRVRIHPRMRAGDEDGDDECGPHLA